MSVPIAATNRLDFHYTIDGLPHVMRFYCKATVDGTTTSGYAMTTREGTLHVDIDGVVEAIANVLRDVHPNAGGVYSGSVLYVRSGTNWNPLYGYTPSLQPDAGGTYTVASQLTINLRDTSFYPMKFLVLESNIAIPLKTTIPTGFSSQFDDILLWFTSAVAGDGTDGYSWIKSRGDRYFGTFVSAISTDNREIRKARHIA